MNRLPIGWRVVRIGDVCKTGSGGTPRKSNKEYYENGSIPWLLSGEVSQGEIYKSKNFITEEGLTNSSAKIFPVNTVLVAMYGATAGQVGILRCEAATNQAVCGIYPNKDLLSEFIFYAMLSKQTEIVATATGNAQPNISQIKVNNTAILLPPLPEQKRIVAILDEIFAGITQAVANAEKNLTNARELFESYLNYILNQKGEGWKKKQLNDVCSIFARGKSRHRPRNDPSLYGGEYPFIQTGDISQADHLIKSYSQTYSEKGLSQSKLWAKGTICIAIVGATIGETGILNFDACFPDSVIGMVVDSERADAFFVEYLLQSFKPKIKAQGEGSARANINLGTFQNLVFPIPPLNIQRQIVSELDILSNESKRLETIYQKKLSALAELKQSILQKAFAGEFTANTVNQHLEN